MAAKYLAVSIIAALTAQGLCQAPQVVQLDNLPVNHISNPIITRVITLPKAYSDVLQSCHLEFPNGLRYDLYPARNLPSNTFEYSGISSQCGFVLREVSPLLSGSYELISVTAGASGALTMTRQNYCITITTSEIQWPN